MFEKFFNSPRNVHFRHNFVITFENQRKKLIFPLEQFFLLPFSLIVAAIYGASPFPETVLPPSAAPSLCRKALSLRRPEPRAQVGCGRVPHAATPPLSGAEGDFRKRTGLSAHGRRLSREKMAEKRNDSKVPPTETPPLPGSGRRPAPNAGTRPEGCGNARILPTSAARTSGSFHAPHHSFLSAFAGDTLISAPPRAAKAPAPRPAAAHGRTAERRSDAEAPHAATSLVFTLAGMISERH